MHAMKFRTFVRGLACLPASAVIAHAHHSLERSNDLKKEVRLHGTIIQVLMRNPHSFLQIEVPNEDGSLQRVALEFPKGANALRKQGINADTLKLGDNVTITMNPPLTARRGVANLKTLRRESDGFEWSDRKLKR
jgi:hypothetical protein